MQNISFQYKFFVFLAPLAFVMLVFLLIYVSKYKNYSKASKAIAALYVGVLGFLLFNFFELVVNNGYLTILFAKLSYIFISTLPVVWVYFSLKYTGRHYLLKPVMAIPVMIIPSLTMVFLFVPSLTRFFWSDISLISRGVFLSLNVSSYGFFFYILMAHCYVFMIIGAIVLLKFAFQQSKIIAIQNITLITGTLIPLVFNLIYVFNIFPGFVKDYSPLAFSLSAAFFGVSTIRFKLLNLIPIVHNLIFQQMNEGLVVLDKEGTIVDINNEAASILQLSDVSPGKKLLDVLAHRPELLHAVMERTSKYHFITERDGEDVHYQLNLQSLSDKKGVSLGQLISIRDISEETLLLGKIEKMAISDDLTQLYNRRHFETIANKEFQRAKRLNDVISIAIFDLDFFKRINDTYGHPVGDIVLKETSAIMKDSLRSFDVLARFGGEEFAVIFPSTGELEASIVCDRVRRLVEHNQIHSTEEGDDVSCTVSVGVTSIKPDDKSPSDTMRRADEALYFSKQNGRNQMNIWISDMADVLK